MTRHGPQGAALGVLVGLAHAAAGLYGAASCALAAAALLVVPGAPASGAVVLVALGAAQSRTALGLWLFPLTVYALRHTAPSLRPVVALLVSCGWLLAEIAPAAVAADPAWEVGLRLLNGVGALAALGQQAITPADDAPVSE